MSGAVLGLHNSSRDAERPNRINQSTTPPSKWRPLKSFMRHPLASSNLHNSPITRTLQQSHLARIVDDCRSVH